MTVAATDPRALLALWEQALPLRPAAREALLAGTPGATTLGAQRRGLLAALQAQAGDHVPLRCHCPACGEAAELDIAPGDLLQALPVPEARTGGAPEHRLDDGPWQLRFRLPAPADVQALADEDDVERFVHRLLQRCVLEARLDGQALDSGALPAALPPPLCELLSARMEALDSAAALALDVGCPGCGHAWTAPFDPGLALWSLLQSQAEQWLLDIDTLARRYGWSEDQILSLSSGRRQAYLQLARAQAEA